MTRLSELADEQCVPAQPGQSPLSEADVASLLSVLDGWQHVEGPCIEKGFAFPNFLTALAFVNDVGGIAEDQGHHPDIFLGWGKVKVQLTTHDVGGLTRADFVVAARIERQAQLSE